MDVSQLAPRRAGRQEEDAAAEGGEARRDERPLRERRAPGEEGARRPGEGREHADGGSDPVEVACAERIEEEGEPDEARDEPERRAGMEALSEEDAVEE